MKEWPEQTIERGIRPFVVATYVEKTGWANAKAAGEMAALLAESTASQEFVERMSQKRGWTVAKTRLQCMAERQPAGDAAKKGKFGEVLHEAALEQFFGMAVICRRYRHAPAPDVSPPART